ncbi:MAG TPA: hypothetical protein VIN04_04180 [Myxococcota bacterium]
MSLAGALENAAEALPALADRVRPANGDPERLLAALAPEEASTLLVWLLEHEPEAGAELALAWADSPQGAAPLTAIDEAQLGKAARKGLRRALHRLRSRGFEVAAPAPEPRTAVLPRLEDELAAALVSAPDPSGAQLLVIVEPSPSGGARLFQAAIDLERGVLEFHVLSATRSQARRLLRDLETNPKIPAARAPRDSLAALLARAAAAQPPDRALPPVFEEWRSRVARPPEGAQTPGELARAALGGAADVGAARAVAERVAAGALGPWPPPLEALRELAEKVQRTAESPLLVDDQQRRAQVENVVGDALDERFAGARGEAAAARLEEAAHVAWRRGDEAYARELLAAAALFRERAPRDNPLARALLDRVLGPMLEMLREERAASPLVRP